MEPTNVPLLLSVTTSKADMNALVQVVTVVMDSPAVSDVAVRSSNDFKSIPFNFIDLKFFSRY